MITVITLTEPSKSADSPAAKATARPPTTREIAEACGCHQSTVSYALRNHPKIPAATRARILTVAKRLGWRPNPFAAAYMSQLRLRRPHVEAIIGFLDAHPLKSQRHWLKHQIHNLNGARMRAKELGYVVETIWLNESGMTTRRLHSILRARNITGVIIPSPMSDCPVLREMTWENYATVAIEFILDKERFYRVATYSAHGFDFVLRKAVELGYRRIAVVVSHAFDRSLDHGVFFPLAYAQRYWAKDLGLLQYEFASPVPDEIPRIQEWLKRQRPEIVLGEDITWRAIAGMGWRVPEDIAFISVSWSPEYPHVAGFDQRNETKGRAAVDLLVGRLTQNEVGPPEVPHHLMVEGCWRDGPSAPALKA